MSVHKDIQVVGQASNGQETVDLAIKLVSNVVLMDMQMPVKNGVSAIRGMKGILPDCRIIALTMFDDKEFNIRRSTCWCGRLFAQGCWLGAIGEV